MTKQEQIAEYYRILNAGPGEGYRNLERGEIVQEGDECLSTLHLRWVPAQLLGSEMMFDLGKRYRRKI